MLKKLLYGSIVGLTFLFVSGEADARKGKGAHKVYPHIKRDGTYLKRYISTNPSLYHSHNKWTTWVNVDPHTGKVRTANPRNKWGERQ